MSKTVDERVVSMQFDNTQFEKNVSTSMTTLDKLKQSLKLDGASKGLDNIRDSASKFSLSGISDGVETVKAKFSALEVMAVTALANITNSAVNAGRRLVSAFSIEPIKSGFEEYETQINSVQTILSNTRSKGTTLDQVNEALDELNHYADLTIYNFTEMTRNIGTFTAAGIDLKTSVSAIKGIANLAAVSGSNAQQASTAMYQLSQALASGTVKLQDWNSVVNAGMGGQVFQDALKETAKVHGIAIDDMIKKEGSFRETLKNGWLSSEILTETLSKFTGDLTEEQITSMGYTKEQAKEIMALGEDANNAATKVKTFTQLMDTLKEAAQSGWTQSWEILVGDFEDAKKLWTSVSDYFSDAIGKSAEARNSLLQAWADNGGRTMAIDAIKNSFSGLLNIIKPIKEAFREVFPPTTAEQLLNLSERIKDLSAKFKEFTSANADKLKSTFKGIFSVVGIGVDLFKALASGASKLVGNLTGLSGGILGITAVLGDWVTKLRDGIKEDNLFGKSVNGIVSFLQKGINKLKEFGKFAKEKFAAPGFEGFLKIVQAIENVIKKVSNKISEVGSKIGEALTSALRSGDISAGLDVLNGGLLAGILLSIKKFMSGVNDAFGEGKFLDKVKNILGGVKDCLESWQKNIKANILLKIAASIAILAGSLLVIAMIKPEKLMASLGSITVLFADLVASLTIMDKFGDGFKGVNKAAFAMVTMSAAVFILAGALKKLSGLKSSELAVGLTGVTVLLSELVGVSILLSKQSAKMVKGSVGLVLLATAIKILASACGDFASMSWGEIAKGLTGVTVLLGELVGVSILLSSQSAKMVKGSVGLVLLAAAIKILASVCGNFASMGWGEIGKGLTGVTVLLGELVGASVLLTKFTKGGQLIAVGIGLIAVSAALNIMASALQTMGGMTWSEIAKGLVTLGVSLGILSAALVVMTGTLAGSAALLVASVSLNALAGVLQKLGSMGIGEIFKSLITLAAALALIGAAGLLLTPVVPGLLGLGAAILLVGVGSAACGAGLLLIAAAFTSLAVAGATGATAVMTALTIIITGIANLIPVIISKIGEGIVTFCTVIAGSASSIGEAFKKIFLTLLDVLSSCAPRLIEVGLELLLSLIQGIRDNIGKITKAGYDIVINFLNAMSEKIPELIQAGIDLMVSFIDGLAQGIENNHEKVNNAIYRLCNAILDAVKDFFGIHSPSTVMANIGKYLIEGLVNGVKNKTSATISTIKELGSKMISSIGSKAREFSSKGSELMSNLKNGISNKISDIKLSVRNVVSNAVSIIGSKTGEFMSKGKDLMSSFKSGISNLSSSISSAVGSVIQDAISTVRGKISEFSSIGSQMMEGMKSGIRTAAGKVAEAAKGVAKNAIKVTKKVLDIHSPSRVFRKIGNYVPEGFAQGIEHFGGLVTKSAINMGNKAVTATSNAISRISSAVNSNIDAEPTIRPVLDLSSVESGASRIGNLLNGPQSVGLMSNIGAINSMMNANNQNGRNNDVISAIKDLKTSISNMSGDSYTINGITYDDGSNVADAVKTLVRATRVERRI